MDALEEEDALEAEDGVSPPELEGDLPADRRGDEDRGPSELPLLAPPLALLGDEDS